MMSLQPNTNAPATYTRWEITPIEDLENDLLPDQIITVREPGEIDLHTDDNKRLLLFLSEHDALTYANDCVYESEDWYAQTWNSNNPAPGPFALVTPRVVVLPKTYTIRTDQLPNGDYVAWGTAPDGKGIGRTAVTKTLALKHLHDAFLDVKRAMNSAPVSGEPSIPIDLLDRPLYLVQSFDDEADNSADCQAQDWINREARRGYRLAQIIGVGIHPSYRYDDTFAPQTLTVVMILQDGGTS